MTRAAGAAVALCALALLAFGALQYSLPETLESPPGLDHAGVRHFEQRLGHALPDLGPARFSWSFRLLLAVAWSAYGLALVAVWLGGRLARPYAWTVAVFVSLAFAVLVPPSLSRDVYFYVANGRALVFYGANPYVETLAQLHARGDEAAAFCPADMASIYGPSWTALSAVLVAALARAGLWWQVVGMKLVAAAATLVCAGCAAALARRSAPVRAELALVAIGLNPLLVIECAGNGHNDATMMALLLLGLVCRARGRPRWGYALVGLSIGVKFVSAAILPWLVLADTRGRPARDGARVAAVAVGLALAPTVLGFMPFWSGLATLSSFAYAHDVQSGGAGGAWAASWLARGSLLLLYAGLSVWLWRSPQPGRLLLAWTIFALALPLLGMPVTFAWYLVWSLAVAPVRFSPLHRVLLACGSFVAYVLQLVYVRPV